jgi:hypothetical protein
MDKRTLEAIESCRPGSEDLRAPELRDVARQLEHDSDAQTRFERIQRWDAKIVDAMQRVDLPVGLAARLLATLARRESPQGQPSTCDSRCTSAHAPPRGEPCSADFGEAMGSIANSPKAESRANVSNPPVSGGWSRRQWIGTLTTVAAGLLLAVVLNRVLRTSDSQPLENIAGAWQKALGPAWREMREAPRGFEVPAGVTGKPAGWQWIDPQFQVRGVAYQLQDAQGSTATLYVARLERLDDPRSPPPHPQSTSVWAVGYWQDGKNVYVLVTRDEATYRRFVNRAPAPLA